MTWDHAIWSELDKCSVNNAPCCLGFALPWGEWLGKFWVGNFLVPSRLIRPDCHKADHFYAGETVNAWAFLFARLPFPVLYSEFLEILFSVPLRHKYCDHLRNGAASSKVLLRIYSDTKRVIPSTHGARLSICIEMASQYLSQVSFTSASVRGWFIRFM